MDGNQITIQMESKIDVQDLIRLNAGEFFTVFQGDVVPSASVYIPDSEKSCDSDPVVINRYISVEAPGWSVSAVSSPGQCSAGSPHRSMSAASSVY